MILKQSDDHHKHFAEALAPLIATSCAGPIVAARGDASGLLRAAENVALVLDAQMLLFQTAGVDTPPIAANMRWSQDAKALLLAVTPHRSHQSATLLRGLGEALANLVRTHGDIQTANSRLWVENNDLHIQSTYEPRL